MLSAEQLQALRQQLPAFPSPAGNIPGFGDYSRHYGLDSIGREPDLAHQAGTISSGGFTLAVQSWTHPTAHANLLLVHGYTDHTGVFNHLVRWGVEQGFNVLIFDLPGHGLSSGAPAVIDDFADYSRAIADVLAAVSLPQLPLVAMGQSTGCAALTDYARRGHWPFAAAVLLAPLVRPRGWLLASLGQRVLGLFREGVERKLERNTSDGAFLEVLKRDALQPAQLSFRWVAALRRWLQGLSPRDLGVGPVLIVQGDDDNTVEWRYNVPFVEKLYPGSRIEYVPGAGHQLANEALALRRDYLSRVSDWLREQGVEIPQS